ncbi:MAG: S24 family peptidase [Pseudomonadota bacterium]
MIATLQEQSCYMPNISKLANGFSMDDTQSDKQLIDDLVEWTGLKVSALAKRAGLAVTTLTRPANLDVNHRLSLPTISKLRETFPDFPGFGGDADAQRGTHDRAYLPVDVLPSFAGMGGGGTAEGDLPTALISRVLIEDELRAKPSDLLVIDVRGDSMEPDFKHGDQILIDRRDRDPRQPGSFALFDGDGYVIKLVERVPGKRGYYRVFSANSRYTEYEIEEESHTIMGRPVWFARRL